MTTIVRPTPPTRVRRVRSLIAELSKQIAAEDRGVHELLAAYDRGEVTLPPPPKYAQPQQS